jgi:hypothetical protein
MTRQLERGGRKEEEIRGAGKKNAGDGSLRSVEERRVSPTGFGDLADVRGSWLLR